MRSIVQTSLLLLISALLFVRCSDSTKDAQPGAKKSNPRLEAPLCNDTGPSCLQRLSSEEYDNVVRDSLDDASQPGQDFPPDVNDSSALETKAPSLLTIESYLTAAEKLSQQFNFNQDIFCPSKNRESIECVRRFANVIGRRLYRRPLDANEISELVALYQQNFPQLGLNESYRAMLEAMLVSPDFLYRAQLGLRVTQNDKSSVLTISAYERAARLSFLFWRSGPDDALLDAAQDGRLNDQDVLNKHALRLLEDPRAKISAKQFLHSWLDLSALDVVQKDAASYPTFNGDLTKLLRSETEKFLEHVVWGENGTTATLFKANYTFLNGPLAKHYGITSPDISQNDATKWVKVDLDATERQGILTQGSLLTIHSKLTNSNPVGWGKFVRERLLCQVVAPPPEEVVDQTLAQLPDDLSPREFSKLRLADKNCAGCHRMMDPIGFTFEHYDAIGRFREKTSTNENIDASGELLFTDVDGGLRHALDLSDKLANSDQVRRCVIEKWLEFSFRSLAPGESKSMIDDTMAHWAEDGYRLKDALISLYLADLDRYPLLKGATDLM